MHALLLKRFGVFYFALLIIHLACIFCAWDALRLATKPMFGVSLSVLVLLSIFSKALLQKLLLSAIVFGTLGDIALMVPDSELTFMLGLGFFLLGHLLYAVIFAIEQKGYPASKNASLVLFLLLLLGAAVYSLLLPQLGELYIPVLVYVLVIIAMAWFAFGRKAQVNPASFVTVQLGALCFLISDSLLAIDRFIGSFPMAQELLMLTYLLAQFCIVIGVVWQWKAAQSL